MKKKVLAVVLALVLAVGIFGAMSAQAADTIKVGYVNPTTGPLAGNGEGAQWAIDKMLSYINDELGGIEVDGEKKPVQIILYDSASDSSQCAEMAQKLIEEDNVDIMVAIQTPETVIPVASTAERYGVPCVAIQAPVNPVAANVAGGFECEWVFHAFWTIENVYECHKALWTAAGYGPGEGYKVGICFASDADGTAWHDIFIEKLPEDGYVCVDPGQYPSGSNDFTSLANTFKAEEIDILAGTNIPPDFLNIYKACLAAGVEVGCLTMGKCCLLPGDVAVLENDTPGLAQGIMTEVWWTPNYPFASATTGITAAELGAAYQEDNDGRDMPQPAGYGYASLEIVMDTLTRAGTLDKEAIRDALRETDLETVVGPIKYDKEMLGLHYGDTVIAGGQWQLQEDGTEKLVVIDNTVYPMIAVEGEYVPGNATNK